MKNWDAFVVGGGLSGLASALFLARAGKRVALFERAHQTGGHAITQNHHGYQFNLGPHALYLKGAGIAVLRELGIEPQGARPGSDGSLMYLNGKLSPLPSNPLSFLTAKFGPFSARLEVGRFLVSLPRKPASHVAHLSVQDWLQQELRHLDSREMIKALIRVSSYTNAPHLQSAELATDQLQRAIKGGVLYLHGGWQSLVDALRAAAEQAGVQVLTSARVQRVQVADRVRGVVLADGSLHEAPSVLLAVSPKDAASLVPENSMLSRAAELSMPVRAATLDVALRALPQPHRTFALGIDKPYYYSVHSRWARLAPSTPDHGLHGASPASAGSVIHVAKYLHPDSPEATQHELESFLEVLQPGMRNQMVAYRFLPNIVVNNALVTVAQGGFAGRPTPEAAGIPGLFLAGDWIGNSGFLADASLASARCAAESLLRQDSLQKSKVA